MRIPRIYQNQPLAVGDNVELDPSATHHLNRVLRLKDQANIILFNGDGFDFSAHISFEGKRCFATLHERAQVENESPLNITLLQGISKGDRMDTVIQKSVELGVSRIIPVICQRTVVNLKGPRAEKKHQHWQGIVINACEQSGRSRIPELQPTVKFNDAIKAPYPGSRFLLHPASSTNLKNHTPDKNSVVVLIGPEGGLTDDEITYAKTQGYHDIQLGPRILRTETAALATISAIQMLWGDLN